MALRLGFLRSPAVVGGLALSLFACSVLVETRSQQCKSDGDCNGFTNAACDLDSHTCVDKRELACKQEGCVCDPATPTDILNTCTTAERHCFDNDAHGVPGTLPAPPSGPVGTGGQHGADECPGGVGGGGTGGSGTTTQLCEDLGNNTVYTIGPTSIKPLLSWVAKFYAKKHVNVVYQDDSSCIAIGKLYGNGSMENDPGNEAWTTYFDATGAERSCKFESPDIKPHIGLSDVFPQSCTPPYDRNHTDKSVVDTAGPVQAFGFIVPSSSQQESISFEAAYMAYGFGDDSGITPWSERKYIYERDPDSGTQSMIGALLHLDPTTFRATRTKSSNDEAALVACSKEPDKTVGILAADLVQEHTFDVKLLAYQHAGQSCGYLPDSTADGKDKANVRDGHYFIWGPIHMLTRASEMNQDALNLIKYVSGVIPAPADEGDLFQHWVDAHLVPQCAMRVKRSTDGGDLEHVTPQNPCSCQYERVANGKTSCARCTNTSADCPICSNDGYCEPE